MKFKGYPFLFKMQRCKLFLYHSLASSLIICGRRNTPGQNIRLLLSHRYFLNHSILKSDFIVVSILSWKPFLLDFPPFHGMMYSHHLHHYILFPIQSLYGSIGYIISISWKMNKKPCTYYNKSRYDFISINSIQNIKHLIQRFQNIFILKILLQNYQVISLEI